MVSPVTRGPVTPPSTRAAEAAGAGPASAADSYTVVKGDSLWKISEGLKSSNPAFKDLSIGKILDLVRAENPQLLSGPKRKPDGGMIFPGDKVKIPQLAAPSAPPPAGGATGPGGTTPPPGGWANTGTPSRTPAAAAAAGKTQGAPQTPAEVLDAKYPAAAQALTAKVVSASQVDFIRNLLDGIKAASPETARTPKFQDLMNKLDDADKQIAAGQKVVDESVPKMIAKLKTAQVKPEEATAMYNSLVNVLPLIRDQQAAFGEVLPLLKAAGAQAKGAPAAGAGAAGAGAGAAASGGAAADGGAAAAAARAGAPAGAARPEAATAAAEARVQAMLEQMLTSEKVPADIRAMINQGRTLAKQGKPDEGQALFNKAMNDPRMEAFVKEFDDAQD